MKTLNVSEAADLLKVHENRVMELAGAGILPGAKIGRAWVFLDEDLMQFVRKAIQDQTATRVLPRVKNRAGSRISSASSMICGR